MKIVKLIFISFLVFFLLITGISLFIPGSLRISKAINIVASPEAVYPLLADTREWSNWHPAVQNNNIQFQFKGEDTVQAGTSTIVVESRNPREIKTTLYASGGRKIQSGWNIMQIAQKDSLTVQWYMDFKLKWYPWEKFASLFYEGMYGVQMESGLGRLKEVISNKN